MALVKFSEFPSETPESADEVVGLHSGDNARFSLANIVLLVRQGLANIFVPNTRKVNNHALSSDITLTASDVGARSSSWTPSASDVGAVPTTAVGSADGVASLGNDGKVPAAQLPPISAEGKADEDTIAPIEATTTATSAHPLGSIFYLNGDLYRALADIAEGGTINTGSGGNATQTTVAANFSRIVKLTAAQYASLSAAEKAADIIYIVTDDELDADDVCYDNTTSGLTATDVQAAIDEVAQGGGGGGGTAASVSYDNTGSGLAATDVQDAIDELAAGGSASGKADETTIAPVEASTTASEAHALGSIFYLEGVLYRALSDIAIGGTINTGTGGNATQTTIAANFSRIVKLTAAQYAQLSAAEKAADIVYIVTDDPAPSPSDSTPQDLGTAAAGSSGNYSRADHVHKKPSAADIGAYVKPSSGIPASDLASGVIPSVPSAYTSNPAMDGTASPGSSGSWAKGDHVHPSDTSKANETELAPVENGTTASQAYAVGAYFCRNGELCRAKTAINSGATLTENTNYTVPSGGLANRIRIATASLTTNASGQVSTGLNVSSGHILAAFASGYEISVYCNSSGVQGYFVKTAGTNTPAASVTISVTAVILNY